MAGYRYLYTGILTLVSFTSVLATKTYRSREINLGFEMKTNFIIFNVLLMNDHNEYQLQDVIQFHTCLSTKYL